MTTMHIPPHRKSNFLPMQLAALLSVLLTSPMSAEEAKIGGDTTVNADATQPASWLERDTLTGD